MLNAGAVSSALEAHAIRDGYIAYSGAMMPPLAFTEISSRLTHMEIAVRSAWLLMVSSVQLKTMRTGDGYSFLVMTMLSSASR